MAGRHDRLHDDHGDFPQPDVAETPAVQPQPSDVHDDVAGEGAQLHEDVHADHGDVAVTHLDITETPGRPHGDFTADAQGHADAHDDVPHQQDHADYGSGRGSY